MSHERMTPDQVRERIAHVRQVIASTPFGLSGLERLKIDEMLETAEKAALVAIDALRVAEQAGDSVGTAISFVLMIIERATDDQQPRKGAGDGEGTGSQRVSELICEESTRRSSNFVEDLPEISRA